MLGVDVDSLTWIQLPKYLRSAWVLFTTEFLCFRRFFCQCAGTWGKKNQRSWEKKVFWRSMHVQSLGQGRVSTCPQWNRCNRTYARIMPFETLKNRNGGWCHRIERSPNVRTCSNAFIGETSLCKMMAIISPRWISMESLWISWKLSRIGYFPYFATQGTLPISMPMTFRIESWTLSPRGMKMSNYPSIIVKTPMLNKTHFGVLASNPHLIRWNLLMSEF